MRATVRRFHSPDGDLSSYRPAEADNFAVLVQAMLAPEGSDGEESFDVLVCTPAWLAATAAASGPVIGRHHLVVNAWDGPVILGALTTEFTSVEGGSWPELAQVLGRIGKWEFEDYRD